MKRKIVSRLLAGCLTVSLAAPGILTEFQVKADTAEEPVADMTVEEETKEVEENTAVGEKENERIEEEGSTLSEEPEQAPDEAVMELDVESLEVEETEEMLETSLVQRKTIPGKWLKSSNRWWYRHNDGSFTKAGWEFIKDKWYYFDKAGWMVTGWRNIGGRWYLLNGNGEMVTGWQKSGTRWYYMDPEGAMLTGWQEIDGKWYLLNGSGAMLTGWQKSGNTWYLLNGSGEMVTGWHKVGSRWYYMKENGGMATGWQEIDGKWYLLNGSGAMLTGWQKSGNTWYLLNGSGAMVTGWQKSGSRWYYMNENGAMVTGWQKIGEKWYYMEASGVMAADTWISGYYVDGSGAWVEDAKKAGWFSSGGRWYYRKADGKKAVGWQSINGKEYYFESDGWMAVGWKKIGNTWYYLKPDGSKAYDYWVGPSGTGGYFINKYGVMVAGSEYSYGNYIYTFDSNGKCTKQMDRYVTVKDSVTGRNYKVEHQYTTDPKVGVDITEDEFLAAVVYSEAGNQGITGMTGVAMVMLNRAETHRTSSSPYPGKIDIMIYQAGQFEVCRNGALTRHLKAVRTSSLYDNAKKAVANAKAINDAHWKNGTPRKVDGLNMPAGKNDFDYMGFMTPKAFKNANLDPDRTYAFTYGNITFYTTWIKKK